MAQSITTLNLNAAVIPFSAAFKGQSVIVPARGDMTAGPSRYFSGDTDDAAANIPQLYWAENILPSQEGYFSVGYGQIVPRIPGDSPEVLYELTLFDGKSNKGVLAIGADKRMWLLSGVGNGWVQLGIGEVWDGYVTTAVAYGVCYIFLPGAGLYSIDLDAKSIQKVTPVGLDESAVAGITDSQSYLIAYSENLVAWSSALDALDFVPSEITGAGAGVPEGLRGQIVFCKSISKGFIIYTTAITMASEYTSNVRFPWIFRALNNGSGIDSPFDVSQDTSMASHYMWGSAGFTEVNVQQCTPRFGQLTDFLAGQVWEEFNEDINDVVKTHLGGQVRVRLAHIAARFLCVSYGRPDSLDYEFVNVYDSVLQRWGRLKFTHRQCFEIIADTEMTPISWEGTDPEVWEDADKAWSSYVTWNNGTAKPKNTVGFIKADGSIHVAQMHIDISGSYGVLLLGRLQLTRTSVSALHGVLIQGINRGKTNFELLDKVTQINDGVDFTNILTPVNQLHEGDYTRQYGARTVGKNHSLILKGSFHVCSAEISLSNVGRR